jgi:transcriptional regulator with XRE-family HTH domain
MNVGKSIKIALINSEMKSKDLADKMGVSPSYISGLANASKNPSIVTVMRIAIALDLQVSEFIALGEEKAA